ncbi:hypothetical protein MNBD_PLANCTO02-529 [hydrothermal vent metagenome]|uniref:DUF502 domain-containing protein n=1 Tax=hydrothermal vent metagenome TaxID=652676 RepID=A0A3B1DKW7_9ZZZZ
MNEKTSPETTSTTKPAAVSSSNRSTMMKIFFRGLAFVLPSILTLVILLWIGGAIYDYIINPVSTFVRFTIAQTIDDSKPKEEFVRWEHLPALDYYGREYLITKEFKEKLKEKLVKQPELHEALQGGGVPRKWIESQLEETKNARLSEKDFSPKVYIPLGNRAVPYVDYLEVAQLTPPGNMPVTSTEVYMELVTSRYFISLFHLSAVSVILAIISIYFAGKIVTIRLGAWLVYRFETGVLGKLPIIRNVYGSVKQVTDFLFTERTIEYNRVVAIEYPRRGIWALAFVTGDSLLEITTAVGEPMVSVLVPSSPMPVTGYTMSVPRSEVIDLNITIDQTFQFTISCGVLVPPQQKVTAELLQQEIAKRLASQTAGFDLIADREKKVKEDSSQQEDSPTNDGTN